MGTILLCFIITVWNHSLDYLIQLMPHVPIPNESVCHKHVSLSNKELIYSFFPHLDISPVLPPSKQSRLCFALLNSFVLDLVPKETQKGCCHDNLISLYLSIEEHYYFLISEPFSG